MDALNPFMLQSVLIVEIAPAQVQDLTLALFEPHEIPMNLFFKFVQVTLDVILSLKCVIHNTQLAVICKPADSGITLCHWQMLNDTYASINP